MSGIKTKTPVASNSPLSIDPAFTSDDLALIIGTCVADAMVMIDFDSGNIVACNQSFFRLLGVDSAFLDSGDVSGERLITPQDRGIFKTWERAAFDNGEVTFETRLQKEGGSTVPVNIVLTSLYWKQRKYLLGFLRELSGIEERESQLHIQIDEQKKRAFEAIKSSLRLYQLNEKIRKTPNLAQKLLHAESEEELFSEAANVLTSEEGLGYREATFLLLDASSLNVVFSTQELKHTTYSLVEENRFSRFIRRGFHAETTSGTGILVPLQSRGQLVGFCEVTPHSREKVFFDESSIVSEWQQDVLCDIGGIIALMVDNLRLNREIKRQSLIDSLTKAYNRKYLAEKLSMEVQRAIRYGRPLSLAFVDLDEFKHINDRYGHLQGDDVLRALGKLFIANVRDVDVVCRYGGDEFVLLLPETDRSMVCSLAEKLLAAVRSHSFCTLDSPMDRLPVTVSIGVSTLLPDETGEDLLHAADAAMYRAKSRGKNRVQINDE